jgi:hypothetical protein
MPHILRHLDPFSNLVLAFDEEIARCTMRPNLLSFQNTIDSIANPPDITSKFAFPYTPNLLPFPRHNGPSGNNIAKYHQKYPRHFKA